MMNSATTTSTAAINELASSSGTTCSRADQIDQRTGATNAKPDHEVALLLADRALAHYGNHPQGVHHQHSSARFAAHPSAMTLNPAVTPYLEAPEAA